MGADLRRSFGFRHRELVIMASVQPPAKGGGTEGDDEEWHTDGSTSDIGRLAKRPALRRDKFVLPRDIIAKVISFLDPKDRLRTRLVCKEWAGVNRETGWEYVNLRFLPDPPRDGVRDEATLFRRAEARARWLRDQNHTLVRPMADSCFVTVSASDTSIFDSPSVGRLNLAVIEQADDSACPPRELNMITCRPNTP